MTKNNAPGRVVTFLLSTLSGNFPASTTTEKVWLECLGATQDTGVDTEAVLSLALADLRGQVRLAGAQLADRGAPGELYQGQFSVLETLLSVNNLRSDFQSMRGNFSGEMLMSLRWAAHYLPAEDADIDNAELNPLREELDTLLAAVENSGLSATTKEFVLRQVRNMQVALRRCPITGIGEVRRVVREVVGDVLEHGDILAQDRDTASPEAKSVLERFGTVWKKVVAFSGDSMKVAKALEYGAGVAQKALPYVKDLFGGGA